MDGQRPPMANALFQWPFCGNDDDSFPSSTASGIAAITRYLEGFRLQEQHAGSLGLLGTPSTNHGFDAVAHYASQRLVQRPTGRPQRFGLQDRNGADLGLLRAASTYHGLGADMYYGFPRSHCLGSPLRTPLFRSLDNILDIMADPDRHNEFVDILEGCSHERLEQVVRIVARDQRMLVATAKYDIGVKSLVKLMETVKRSSPLCDRITSVLGPHETLELMKHPVGYKLVEYCLHHLDYEDMMFVFVAAGMFCVKLAITLTGSKLINLCIEKAGWSIRRMILEKLTEDAYALATDKYGNYVIQNVLVKYGDKLLTNETFVSVCICFQLGNHLVELSKDRHGSYVLESCIKSFGGVYLLQLLVSMDNCTLQEIAEDPSGNYVLQVALKTFKGNEHAQLVHSLSQLPKRLLADIHAKHVLDRARKLQKGNMTFGSLDL